MKKIGFLLIIQLIISFSLAGMDIKGIETRIGLVSYGYTGETRYTSSPLKESLGAALPMVLNEKYEFRPELTLFYFDYVWDSESERAVPAAIETADRISVFHFFVSPAFSRLFPLDEKIVLGISASPSFLFRLPLIASDNGEDYRRDISGYLYSAGRFFYPSFGGFFRWQFAEKTALDVSAGICLPLFHLWDGSEEPFNDQMIINFNAGFLFSF